MNRKRRIGNPLLSLVLVLSLESIKQKVAEKKLQVGDLTQRVWVCEVL